MDFMQYVTGMRGMVTYTSVLKKKVQKIASKILK